jgi:3'-phosphoadenosine 5'-phosphosulfate sulfotransferase (PAPS reductase)/FAD synthetase
MNTRKFDKYEGFVVYFSGGRDSYVALKIAYHVAKALNKPIVVVFIDTTIGIKETRQYVESVVSKLGIELIVIRPKLTYKEYAAKYPYWPHLTSIRWCMFMLKVYPIADWLKENPRYLNWLHILGVRKAESTHRNTFYNELFSVRCYKKNVCVETWYPLLYVEDEKIEELVKYFGNERNPVWEKLGRSGDCECAAAHDEDDLERVLIYYPEIAKEWYEIDEVIHKNRRSSEPSYMFALRKKKIRYKDWYEQKIKEIDKLKIKVSIKMPYLGKGCRGSCLR